VFKVILDETFPSFAGRAIKGDEVLRDEVQSAESSDPRIQCLLYRPNPSQFGLTPIKESEQRHRQHTRPADKSVNTAHIRMDDPYDALLVDFVVATLVDQLVDGFHIWFTNSASMSARKRERCNRLTHR